jgi:FxLD family lantipeptide
MSTTAATQTTIGALDEFDLDITLVEIADSACLVPSTDDGCGSTCGACVSNA